MTACMTTIAGKCVRVWHGIKLAKGNCSYGSTVLIPKTVRSKSVQGREEKRENGMNGYEKERGLKSFMEHDE